MDFISVQEASKKWGISERRIQKLCEENRIQGAVRFSRMWLIPKDAEKPVDGRRKENKNF
jgi:excisionase family DNA binding protein